VLGRVAFTENGAARYDPMRNGPKRVARINIVIAHHGVTCFVTDLLEGNVMIPPLDVFAIEDGEHKWLACAETQAKALELIGNRGPGSYFVFSQETGNRIFYEVVARMRRWDR